MPAEDRTIGRVTGWFDRFQDDLGDTYQDALRWSLKHKLATLGVALLSAYLLIAIRPTLLGCHHAWTSPLAAHPQARADGGLAAPAGRARLREQQRERVDLVPGQVSFPPAARKMPPSSCPSNPSQF